MSNTTEKTTMTAREFFTALTVYLPRIPKDECQSDTYMSMVEYAEKQLANLDKPKTESEADRAKREEGEKWEADALREMVTIGKPVTAKEFKELTGTSKTTSYISTHFRMMIGKGVVGKQMEHGVAVYYAC